MPGNMSIDALLELHSLKEVSRAGWIRRGIHEPEGVAAHSWGVAWLAMLLCPDELDSHRVLQLCLIHDLIEVRTGDITPFDGITPAEKTSLERKACQELLAKRPDLAALWSEYDVHATPESGFVHELDKLDMALQALHYSRTQGLKAEEFIESASLKISHPRLRGLLDQITAAWVR